MKTYRGTILRAIYILNLESEASILNKWSIKGSEFVAPGKQNKWFYLLLWPEVTNSLHLYLWGSMAPDRAQFLGLSFVKMPYARLLVFGFYL